MELFLASGSPRRRELLHDLGWSFTVEPARITETEIPGEGAENMVRRLAETKAADVRSRHDGCWVVGADTVVVIDGHVLGKPKNREEAVSMICELQGRTHTVMTGVAIFAADGNRLVACEKTDVTFRRMSRDEAEAYVAQGESMDKAGAYAIQERGTLLVTRVNGCYFNVVGLPLERLSEMMAELGWPLASQWRG